MLQLMRDVPANFVGVSALAVVTGDDYKTMLVPALEKAVEEVG